MSITLRRGQGCRIRERRVSQLQPQVVHSSAAGAGDALTPESLSVVGAEETAPLVEGVKEENGGKEFTAAFYRTRLITFGAMVTGCATLPLDTLAIRSKPNGWIKAYTLITQSALLCLRRLHVLWSVGASK